jgi:chemotaxis signal transduction protein
MTTHTTSSTATNENALDVLSLLDADSEARALRGEPRHGIIWQRGESASLRMLIPRGLRAEILIQPTINRLPGSPPWLLGLVNARGELIPVIDLPIWAGLPRSIEKIQRVLHLGAGEQSFALLVDAEPRLLFTQATMLYGTQDLPQTLQAFVVAHLMSEDLHWFDLDYVKWLSSFSRNR